MVYYFAYGSNMSLEQMKKRCGNLWKKVGIGYVEGYELVFDGDSDGWRGPTADMVENPNEKVWGVLFEFPSFDDLTNCLDKYEGYPYSYTRKEFEVFLPEMGKNIKAIAYVRPEPKERGKPPRSYIETILKGAIENGLPNEWIEHLRKFL
jgi:cation transport regulator ChaC